VQASVSGDGGSPPDQLVEVIVGFLRGIGIPCAYGKIDARVLPGISIAAGGLAIDLERLEHPGDLLHEAGHLAMVPPERRSAVDLADLDSNQGDEIGAELWSFLAATHLDLPPELVFHDDGYQGTGAWFVETYRSGVLIGQPLLEWMGILDANGAVISWLRTRPGSD
jgi:hypothetical protein